MGGWVAVHLFANVGFTAEMIVPSIRRRPDLDGIVLFHGDRPETKAALDAIEVEADHFEIPVRRVLVDVFDPVAAFSSYLTELKRLPADEVIVFNLAGGTGMVTAAATAFAVMAEIPMVYVRRDTHEELPLPGSLFGFRFRYADHHVDTLSKIGSEALRVKEVAEKSKRSVGRVSVVLSELEDGGFIESVRSGREKRVSLTDFGRFVLEADSVFNARRTG